jgi:hypothetical protein
MFAYLRALSATKNAFMQYSNGEKMSYDKLSDRVGNCVENSVNEYIRNDKEKRDKFCDEKLKKLVENTAVACFTGNGVSSFILSWRDEMKKITKNSLQGKREDGSFHRNYLFDMREYICSNNPSCCLKLFAQGMNARRIMDGEKPKTDFMPTTTLIEAHIELQSKGHKPSAKSQYFIDTYSGFLKYSKLADEVNEAIRTHSIYFDFKKKRNETTGANMYDLEDGVRKCGNMNFKNVSKDELLKTYDFICSSLEKVICDEELSEFNKNILLWNMSEYVSKFHCYCLAYGRTGFFDLPENTCYNKLINMSKKGDFPGGKVNKDVEENTLSILFFEE